MFAFAVIHGTSLLLCRDRLGIKPLYYALTSDARTLVFASEIKAMLQSRLIDPVLNMTTLGSFFALGYPIGTETFFHGIKSVAPSHILVARFDDTLHLTEQFYATSVIRAPNTIRLDEAQEALWSVLDDAVRRHVDADVDVAFTLSGGIDSTMLALIAAGQTDAPLTLHGR